MPSLGISIHCAQIFWTPSRNLVEFKCAFCLDAFLNYYDCVVHFKACAKESKIFEKFPEPEKGDDTDELEPDHDDPVVKLETDFVEYVDVDVKSEVDPAEDHIANEINSDSILSDSDNREESDIVAQESPLDRDLNNGQTSTGYSRDRDTTISCLRRKLMPSRGRANNFGNLLCKNKDVICDMCGCKKRTRRGILHHMIITHHDKIARKELRCPICAKVLANTSSLSRHIDAHSIRYSCEYCGHTFSDKTNLKVHIRTHTGERPFTCKLCGNTFASTNSLKLHMRMHSNERPFKCPECPRTFITKTKQKSHLNVHTRAYNEKCDICGKFFTSHESFKQHGRIHTGLRPYKCDVCDRRFERQNAYSVHMNTHTGNSPYACKYCERRFHSPAARRSHEKGVHKVA